MSPTARQMDVLRYVKGYLLAKGCAPKIREIGAALGISSTSKVHERLEGLQERGLLRRIRYRMRSTEVLTDIPVPRSPTGEPLYFVRFP